MKLQKYANLLKLSNIFYTLYHIYAQVHQEIIETDIVHIGRIARNRYVEMGTPRPKHSYAVVDIGIDLTHVHVAGSHRFCRQVGI